MFALAVAACDAEDGELSSEAAMIQIGEIETYGGPFVFASWHSLDAWCGGDGLDPSQQTTLHYYGQFTSELPEPFAREGGHVYLPTESAEELTRRMSTLRDLVVETFPGTTETAEPSGFVLTRPDRRMMWVLRHPESRYEMACDAGGDENAWRFAITDDVADSSQRGVFWVIEGQGAAELHAAPDSSSIVAMRVWLNEGADAASLRERVLALPADGGRSLGTLQLDESGFAVLFSACTVRDVERIPMDVSGIEAAALDQFGTRVGMVLPSIRGTFAVHQGEIESPAGAVTWIRFTREGG